LARRAWRSRRVKVPLKGEPTARNGAEKQAGDVRGPAREQIPLLISQRLAKACDYMLTRCSRLSRFLEYQALELGSHLARTHAFGSIWSPNWISIDSQEAGPRVAAILSIAETCRRLSLPVRDNLGAVLPGPAAFPANRVAEVTPMLLSANQKSALRICVPLSPRRLGRRACTEPRARNWNVAGYCRAIGQRR
jgi:hypothetical protein